MSKFMLLLHEEPSALDGFSPEEIQRVIQKYSAWREGLAEAGQLAGGEKLKDEGGRLLSRQNGAVRVVDGPFSEAKEIMAGFFMIEAADYDEAVEISRGCPHLEFGRVELREIDPLHE